MLNSLDHTPHIHTCVPCQRIPYIVAARALISGDMAQGGGEGASGDEAPPDDEAPSDDMDMPPATRGGMALSLGDLAWGVWGKCMRMVHLVWWVCKLMLQSALLFVTRGFMSSLLCLECGCFVDVLSKVHEKASLGACNEFLVETARYGRSASVSALVQHAGDGAFVPRVFAFWCTKYVMPNGWAPDALSLPPPSIVANVSTNLDQNLSMLQILNQSMRHN
jgi:hypothetical protein